MEDINEHGVVSTLCIAAVQSTCMPCQIYAQILKTTVNVENIMDMKKQYLI